MRIALLLDPPSDHHLKLAAQVGATDIVATYPGPALDDLLQLRDRIAGYGLKLSVIERLIPHDQIVHAGPNRDDQIANFKGLIRNMGKAGVGILCYNWMPDDDWQRTAVDIRERGGALVTGYDQELAEAQGPGKTNRPGTPTSAEDLWTNFEYFLNQVIPVAQAAGVKLALHPDDPPLPMSRGQARIMIDFNAFERAVNVLDSPANGLCFCQGSFASGGEDVIAGIKRLAPKIHFAHFRDVVGTVPNFRESFQDNGQTDMLEAMRAWHDIGFTGPIRPDHVPTLDGETNQRPGYEILGRLWAVGYMTGLIEAVNKS